jgi:hypothetical protein
VSGLINSLTQVLQDEPHPLDVLDQIGTARAAALLVKAD